MNAQAELARLDTDVVVEYQTETVDVPRRTLSRRTVQVPLPQPPRAGAWVETEPGVTVDGDTIEVEAGWRRRLIDVAYRGPSRDVNAERIDELKQLLHAMSDEQRRTIAEVEANRFSQPVLFVSHRWDDPAHPDPSGSQLRRLRALQNCFLIYDYSSFPQPPRSIEEEAEFQKILHSMSNLVRKVVVLGAPDYLSRGWCVYEYIVASLHGSTVCDEVQDPRFVALRDWASTPPPVTISLRDSFESQQQNAISERILDLLPVFQVGDFTEERDRGLVTDLLFDHLQRTLPPIKESPEYGGGEWGTRAWTTESLSPYFAGEARPRLESGVGIRRFDSSVPSTLQEASVRGYTIERFPVLDLLDPQSAVLRARRPE